MDEFDSTVVPWAVRRVVVIGMVDKRKDNRNRRSESDGTTCDYNQICRGMEEALGLRRQVRQGSSTARPESRSWGRKNLELRSIGEFASLEHC